VLLVLLMLLLTRPPPLRYVKMHADLLDVPKPQSSFKFHIGAYGGAGIAELCDPEKSRARHVAELARMVHKDPCCDSLSNSAVHH